MKLEGSLDAFSLPDVFQLLAFTKKTGGLHLLAAGGSGIVWFAEGQVTGASAGGGRQALGKRLLASSAIEDEALSAAVERVADDDSVGLAKALLEAQSVDEGLLHELVTDAIYDATFELLGWAEGYFAFELDEANPDAIGVTLTGEDVLTEARQRREAWDRVGGVVNPATVLAMVSNLEVDPVLSREDWSLLAHTDGRRSVADIMELTGGGQFSVATSLADLVERGLLQVADQGEQSSPVERRAELLARLGTDEPTAWEPLSVPGVDHPRSSTESVVPARPEPFLPRRQVDHPDVSAMASLSGQGLGEVSGSTALAPQLASMIERDPSINRSLLLRLIAGVRGL